MKYSKKLHSGIFLKRYKRFFADVEFQGNVVVAHVPNTGSMKGLNVPGQPCLISESTNPERKLKFTLEMIQASTGAWVGVNTATPNSIVREALLSVLGKTPTGSFAHWGGFDEVKPEYKISAETRLDFALKKAASDKFHFIEVKNVTLAEGEQAQFPDAVSERAQKHVRELMALMDQGHSAELIFTVQRNDCKVFSPADHIDPEYGKVLREAVQRGLRVTPLVVNLDAETVELSEILLPLHI